MSRVTATPHLRYTNVGRDERGGVKTGASSYGGAVLASYASTKGFALAGRVEAEGQTGRRGNGTGQDRFMVEGGITL